MLKFKPEGIYCEPGQFYIDPWKPVDRALITHAHGDHARQGMQRYLSHEHSLPILKARLGEDIQIQGVAYGESLNINGVKVSFHPAGHVIGSAQIRLEYKGRIVVISGDYKLQDDGLSAPFEPVKCHEFVTESTFGLPVYHWASIEEQNKQLQDWVLDNQRKGKTPVLIGYSLGKAQRILKALEGVGEVVVHYSIGRLNAAFEAAGVQLPAYSVADFTQGAKQLQGKIILLPPALLDSNIIRKIPQRVIAICSGWMRVRGARRWQSADAGFAMSDHADWPDLLSAIRATGAEKVYVTHGYTAAFSKYLNEIGIPAQELKTAYGEVDELLPKTED